VADEGVGSSQINSYVAGQKVKYSHEIEEAVRSVEGLFGSRNYYFIAVIFLRKCTDRKFPCVIRKK
jgi:hypothetical protein